MSEAEFCRKWQVTPQEGRAIFETLEHLMRISAQFSETRIRKLLGDEVVDALKQEAAWKP